ncbi:MAG: PAN domain-containing protein [Parvibaculaceae bacterium]
MGYDSSQPNRWHYAFAVVAYLLIAAIASPGFAASPAVFMERNTDRPGGDYRVITAGRDGPRHCAAECAGDDQCRAWTYVQVGNEGPNATCHLKLTVPHPQATPCCVSGVTVGSGEPGRRRGY